jgi:uncharacterized protein
MRQHLPREIDPFKLAYNGVVLEGTMQLSEMPRLCGALTDSNGDVEVKIQFDIDELGIPFVSGQFKTTLSLLCERCMQPMPYAVDSKLLLALVKHESRIENLAEQYEPWLIEGDDPVKLSELIEDELILALPIVPKHPEACLPAEMWSSGDEVGEEDKPESPFAVLSALKKNND